MPTCACCTSLQVLFNPEGAASGFGVPVCVPDCTATVLAAAGIMIEPLFNSFATAAFFQFVIFAIFEMRWMLLAWRARRTAQVTTADAASTHAALLCL